MPPAAACADISPLKAILSISYSVSACSIRRAAMPSTGASCSPGATAATSSTSTGRSITAAFPHRLLHGSKGGLYAWEQVQHCPEVILVEGLFDYAVLWQAGFRHVTCSFGTHLNVCQFQQLCDRPRTVYLTFDADANGSGQHASQQLALRLRAQGIFTRRVLLPDRHDPNSFFVHGADRGQFQSLLEAALP
jgi:DNA primase